MKAEYVYLAINMGAVIIPFIFSFHKKIQFQKQWQFVWPAIISTALVFIAWDMYYTRLGVWGFNERYLTGLKIHNLPVEEILFFICIPYSSLFTYYCFEKFELNASWLGSKWISLLLSLTLLVIGISFYNKLYTGVTFTTLALVTFYVAKQQAGWLANFYLMYIVILLPFFIVNGLLTGTGLAEPVVWYDNNENLSIRILTIPLEDIFYGMLLLLLNTFLFEQIRKKWQPKR